MILDDGILEIYKLIPSKSESGKPIQLLELVDKAWYGNINTSISEYYNAKQADVQIEKRVEIWQNRSVNTKDVVVIDNVQYSVGRVYHGINEDEEPITDLTLEKAVCKYEFK